MSKPKLITNLNEFVKEFGKPDSFSMTSSLIDAVMKASKDTGLPIITATQQPKRKRKVARDIKTRKLDLE